MKNEQKMYKLGNKMYSSKSVKAYMITFYILGGVMALLGLMFFSISIISAIFILLFAAILLLFASSYKQILKGKVDASLNETKTKTKTVKTKKQDYEIFHVAGTSYHQDEIKSLISGTDELYFSKSAKEYEECCAYDKVYKNTFNINEVSVQPEPDNQYDPNAMKVTLDGVFVGYIKKDDLERFNIMINLNLAHGVVAEVKGGPYKKLYFNDDDKAKLISKSDDYYITLKFKI